MAAPTTLITYSDWLVRIGDADIEGLETADLEITQELIDSGGASANTDAQYCRSVRGATLTMGGVLMAAAGTPICNPSATVSLDNGSTDIKGVGGFTINATANMVNVTTHGSSGYIERSPGKRTHNLNVDAFYYDPLGTGANNATAITDAIDGDQTINPLVTLGGSTYGGASTVGYSRSVTVSRPDDEFVRLVVDMVINGTPETSFVLDTVLDSLAEAIYAGTSLTYQCVPASSGTPITGATEYEFSGYVSSWQITSPATGKTTWSATVESTSTITETAVPA